MSSSSLPFFIEGFVWNGEGYLVTTESYLHCNECQPMILKSVRNVLQQTLLMTDQDIEKLTTAGGSSSMFPNETLELESLRREHNLFDKLRKIVTLIDKMQLEETIRDGDKYNGKKHDRRGRKVTQLAKQQDLRLKNELKQQELSGSQNGGYRRHSSSMTTDKDNDGDDDGEKSVETNLRLVRTINSIRCMFPHILCILNHPRKKDEDLCINGINIQKDVKGRAKAKGWCFGMHVYDIVGNKQCNKFEKDIHRMISMTFPGQHNVNLDQHPIISGSELDCKWKNLFPSFFAKEQQTIAAPYPLDKLFERNIQESDVILSNAIDCDQALGPRLQNRQHFNNYQRSIDSLVSKLKNMICRSYRDASLHIYGSCLSDLALGNSSDVDISLHLPEALQAKKNFAKGTLPAASYEKIMKNHVWKIGRKISDHGGRSGFVDIEVITRARVPVIKGKYLYANNPYTPDGAINFDLCFLNDIAVVNSSLLREYSLVDPRAKLLMLFVKAWARDGEVNSAADNSLSSYTWMNMVIFYLQCLDMLPNLQDPTLMSQSGVIPNPMNPFHCVDGLSTAFATWEQVRCEGHWRPPSETSPLKDVPVTGLLYGFFDFYLNVFPHSSMAVSMRLGGKSTMLKTEFENPRFTRLCVEDPFETFDSHCPHDLGSPCGEFGWESIQNLMIKTQTNLDKFLCRSPTKKQRQVHVISDISQFWPSEIHINGTNGRNPQRGQRGKARPRPQHNKKKQHGGNGQSKNKNKSYYRKKKSGGRDD